MVIERINKREGGPPPRLTPPFSWKNQLVHWTFQFWASPYFVNNNFRWAPAALAFVIHYGRWSFHLGGVANHEEHHASAKWLPLAALPRATACFQWNNTARMRKEATILLPHTRSIAKGLRIIVLGLLICRLCCWKCFRTENGSSLIRGAKDVLHSIWLAVTIQVVTVG